MKKFLALVLALLMALSCFSFAGAEGETTPGATEWHCETDGHVMGELVKVVSDATCTAKKVETHKCTKCGKEVNFEVGNALGHAVPADLTTADSYKDSTCTEPGYYHFNKCSRCGQPFDVADENKPAKTHDWQNVKVVEATCAAAGYIDQKCSRCDATQTVPNGEKLEHIWSNTDEAKDLMEGKGFDQFQEYYKAPTCLEYGYAGTAPYCVREGCTAVKEDESTLKQLDKLTHTAKDNGQPNAYGDAYNKLTAMFFSYDAKGNCIGSNKAEGEGTITKDEHNLPYGDLSYEYKAATCAEDGFVTVTCECGWTKTEKIAKLDHKRDGNNMIYVVSIKYLDKNGNVVRLENFAEPLPLDSEELEDAENRIPHYENLYDCTLEMVAHYRCALCEKEWDGETFCFTEHQYAVYSVAQTDVKGHAHSSLIENPTGAAEVAMPEWVELCHDYDVTYKCVRCQQTKTETVKGEGHDEFLQLTVSNYKKDTCTVPGSDIYTCSECGISLIVNHTGLANHDEEVIELVNNTCTTNGKRVFKCKNCGATRTEIIPATGHEEYLAKTEAATCEKTGLKTYKCARCGEVTRTEVLNRKHVVTSSDDIKVKRNVNIDLIPITEGDDAGKFYLVYSFDVDCTKNGTLEFICAHCNKQTLTYTAKADHNWTKIRTIDDPEKPYTFIDDEICQKNTIEIYECEDCEAGKLEANLKKVEVATKEDHVLTKEGEKVLKYAKCGVEGEALKKCTHCNEWVKVTIPAMNHRFETTWDAKNEKWTYTCQDCGYVEDIEFTAPRFVIDTSKINWANKTTGTGTATLEEQTTPILFTPVVYLRWTWVTKDGCDVVADVATTLNEDGTFNAKCPYTVSGATLSEMLIIVTDDQNPADMSLSAINKLGYAVLKK